MATKFRLPTLTTTIIGKKPANPSLGQQGTLPGLVPSESVAPQGKTASLQETIIRDQARDAANLKEFEPKEFYTQNTKLVLSRLVAGKIIGDNTAREVFRKYVEYVNSDPDPFEDFVTHIYGDDDATLSQVVNVLNGDLVSEIPALFPIKPQLIKTEENVSSDVGFSDFCRRHRMPLLATSTKDLLLFGIANPSIAEGLKNALLREFPEMGNPRIDFVLLPPATIRHIFN